MCDYVCVWYVIVCVCVWYVVVCVYVCVCLPFNLSVCVRLCVCVSWMLEDNHISRAVIV